jgi:hypothetical protein
MATATLGWGNGCIRRVRRRNAASMPPTAQAWTRHTALRSPEIHHQGVGRKHQRLALSRFHRSRALYHNAVPRHRISSAGGTSYGHLPSNTALVTRRLRLFGVQTSAVTTQLMTLHLKGFNNFFEPESRAARSPPSPSCLGTWLRFCNRNMTRARPTHR